MARKSVTFNPVKQEKVLPDEPMNPPITAGKVIVAFGGSWNFKGERYEGVHEWDANDERLYHAQGCYKIVGRK